LNQTNFALTTDILNESGVLPSIAALTSPRNQESDLVAHIYKLNSYTAGGFFKAHRDTPKSERHIGTLVVALPFPFEGGALRISHEGKQVLFNWGEKHLSSTEEVCLPWAFLFSDVEHEVLPVTSGSRITLAYDIFSSAETPPSAPQVVDGATLPFYSDLQAVLNNRDFLPRGGKLGVALSHTYAFNSAGTSRRFASHLKGADAALHRALLALGIPMQLRAVYSPDDAYERHNYEWGHAEVDFGLVCDMFSLPHDEYGPIGRPRRRYFPDFLHTSRTFQSFEGHNEWEQTQTHLLEEEFGAQIEPEIICELGINCQAHIWISNGPSCSGARKPSQDAFSESGHYIAYGNEASIKPVYVAAALVLDIPARQSSPPSV